MILFWNNTTFAMSSVMTVMNPDTSEVVATLTAKGDLNNQIDLLVGLCSQYGVKKIYVTEKALLHYKEQINTALLTNYDCGQAVEMEIAAK